MAALVFTEFTWNQSQALLARLDRAHSLQLKLHGKDHPMTRESGSLFIQVAITMGIRFGSSRKSKGKEKR
jgi:hypothetical protein